MGIASKANEKVRGKLPKKDEPKYVSKYNIDVATKMHRGELGRPRQCVVTRNPGGQNMTYGISSSNPTKGKKAVRWYMSSHSGGLYVPGCNRIRPQGQINAGSQVSMSWNAHSGVITWKVNGRTLHEISPTEGNWKWEITRRLFE
jgi:hypothetical protein